MIFIQASFLTGHVMNFEEKLVSIVIVTWNSADTLRDCLSAIAHQTYPSIELLVVDNASKDTSLEIIREVFPHATIIQNETNTGFCIAQNQGISAARGEYVMPLNP